MALVCYRCKSWPCDCSDGITQICGDSREVLPLLEPVDLLLTDPPWGMNLNTDNRRFSGPKGHISKHGNDIGTGDGQPIAGDSEPFDPSFMLDAATEKIIWGWNHFSDRLPSGSCLVWIKRNEASFGFFLSDAEVAWKSKGTGVYCRRDLSNNAITRQRAHPTQKPVGLMSWCLSMFPDAQTVIDPFAGSGTTGVAAKLHNRKAILIEIEEKYCEIAANRLRQSVLQFGDESVTPPA